MSYLSNSISSLIAYLELFCSSFFPLKILIFPFSPSKTGLVICILSSFLKMSFLILPFPFLIWALHPTFMFPTELLSVFLITIPWPNQLQHSPIVRPTRFLSTVEARVECLSGKSMLQTRENWGCLDEAGIWKSARQISSCGALYCFSRWRMSRHNFHVPRCWHWNLTHH